MSATRPASGVEQFQSPCPVRSFILELFYMNRHDRLDPWSFAANKNINSKPHLQPPSCADESNTKCSEGQCIRAQHAHVVQHTHSTHPHACVLCVSATKTQPCVRPSRARGILVKSLENSLRGRSQAACPSLLLSLSVTRRGGCTATLDERRAQALRVRSAGVWT